MKSIKQHMPKQTRSLNREERLHVVTRGASTAEGVKASGWLDLIGKAARGIGSVI